MKVKNDHRSKFSNLSNWKEEAWKNQGFNGIRTRDLRDTGAMLYQMSYEATHWERGQFIEFIIKVAVNDLTYTNTVSLKTKSTKYAKFHAVEPSKHPRKKSPTEFHL